MLNLRQIEVFHAIMTTGSLSEAGRVLCVSQPAISRVLASAENRLKFLLFERVKGRLQPTPEARLLFAEAIEIQEGVKRFNILAQRMTEGMVGQLSIVSSPTYSEWLVPRTIGRFRARHPDVQIKYRSLSYDLIVAQVLLGHADLGILSTEPTQGGSLAAKEIGQSEVVCALPVGHALAQHAVIAPGDLVGHTFIGFNPNSPYGQLTNDFLRLSAGPRIPDIEATSTPEAVALVRQGVGVALIDPYGLPPGPLDDIVLKRIDPAPTHKIYVVHARTQPLSNLAKGFMATLRHVLQNDHSPLDAMIPRVPGRG